MKNSTPKSEFTLAQMETLFREHSHFKEIPLCFSILQKASEITDIPELHDRLIGATAPSLALPLLTNDPTLQNSRFIESLWE